MVEDLINCLLDYKTTYQGVDFDCDKPRQYKMLREAMAKLYSCGEETKFFGPISVKDLPHNFKDLTQSEQKSLKQKQKEERDLVARGIDRVNEKVKEIRQKFSKAVVSQNRSGSGKIV